MQPYSVVVGDITNEETITGLVNYATEDFRSLDIWVSNAGTSDHRPFLIR